MVALLCKDTQWLSLILAAPDLDAQHLKECWPMRSHMRSHENPGGLPSDPSTASCEGITHAARMAARPESRWSPPVTYSGLAIN